MTFKVKLALDLYLSCWPQVGPQIKACGFRATVDWDIGKRRTGLWVGRETDIIMTPLYK